MEVEAADPRAQEDEKFADGESVFMVAKMQPDIDGKIGVVKGQQEDGRYVVLLQDGRILHHVKSRQMSKEPARPLPPPVFSYNGDEPFEKWRREAEEWTAMANARIDAAGDEDETFDAMVDEVAESFQELVEQKELERERPCRR